MTEQKIIGKKIKEKRIEKDLTQMQLAELLDVHNVSVSDWENGRYLKTVTLFIKLMKLLDIEVRDL